MADAGPFVKRGTAAKELRGEERELHAGARREDLRAVLAAPLSDKRLVRQSAPYGWP